MYSVRFFLPLVTLTAGRRVALFEIDDFILGSRSSSHYPGALSSRRPEIPGKEEDEKGNA